MNKMLEQLKERIKLLWINSSKAMKTMIFSIIGIVLALIIVFAVITSATNYVPLYSNVSLQEVSQIKLELESRNVPYEIADGGTTIKVPKERKLEILVDLAGQKIPNSGNIDYNYFSDNASWGITDNQFNVIKLNAMQTELANLIKTIDGVENAKVLINMPERPIFVSDTIEDASVAITLQTRYGFEFNENQIDALYHLISKALPNLSEDNISIIDQYSNRLSRATVSGSKNVYTDQQTIRKEIEKDIQHRLQQMLAVMVGADSVIVSVTADIDFKSENRIEELVEPVDIENMEGLPISIESIKETYSGNQQIGGVVGTGEEDIPNYQAGENGLNDGEYELVKDTINYEINRIYKEIVESPYRLRDLGIQVVVDNVRSRDGDNVVYLSTQEQGVVQEGITSLLNSIITTSIDKDFGDVDPEQNISIVFQEFAHKDVLFPETDTPSTIPLWVYITGAALIVVIILLLVLLLVRRGRREDELEEAIAFEQVAASKPDTEEIPDIPTQPLSETEIKKKQLENMVSDQPEEFTKLLRSWLSSD